MKKNILDFDKYLEEVFKLEDGELEANACDLVSIIEDYGYEIPNEYKSGRIEAIEYGDRDVAYVQDEIYVYDEEEAKKKLAIEIYNKLAQACFKSISYIGGVENVLKSTYFKKIHNWAEDQVYCSL